jgi:hypothetical protein
MCRRSLVGPHISQLCFAQIEFRLHSACRLVTPNRRLWLPHSAPMEAFPVEYRATRVGIFPEALNAVTGDIGGRAVANPTSITGSAKSDDRTDSYPLLSY